MDEYQLYRTFAAQLCEWSRSGKTPDTGNQDIRYGLNLQKARLEKFGASAEYQLNLRGEWLDDLYDAVFSDAKYTNRLVSGNYQKIVNYFIKGKKRLSISENEMMYAIITRLSRAETQGTEPYCCPNCGAISKISELIEGCSYCGTRFLMSDLFPKITNYYFFMDPAMNNIELKSFVNKWIIGGAAVGFLFIAPRAIFDYIQAGASGLGLMFTIFRIAFISGLFAFFGYAAGALSKFFKLLKEGIRQAPMAFGQLNAKKKLKEFMKQYDPSFSFEYFVSRVQSLMKILMFTDECKNLAVYDGKEEVKLFGNLIDAQYGGALGLNRCFVKGNYCFLDLNVHMIDVYCRGDRIFQKNEEFQIGLCKNIRTPINYGFSIKAVSCKSCGASFDASKERFCPYCKSNYHLKEDDWVITFIRKKR